MISEIFWSREFTYPDHTRFGTFKSGFMKHELKLFLEKLPIKFCRLNESIIQLKNRLNGLLKLHADLDNQLWPFSFL